MPTNTPTFAPAGTWQLDPTHSTVSFGVPYLAGTFKGQFHDVEAKLEVTEQAATLSGVARVESVDVREENLNAHLQSPDFFDVERHPELRFTADRIDLDGDAVDVRGEIEIKGVTKQIEVTGTAIAPLTDGFGRERIGLALKTTVDRTDFGLNWNMDLPTGGKSLGNDVAIVAELYFVRA